LSYHGVCVCVCARARVRGFVLVWVCVMITKQYYVHGIWNHLLWLSTVYLIVFDVKLFFRLSGRLTIFFWVQPRTYFWNYLKVLRVYWNIKLHFCLS
jgi:hypothetical protein